jgi:hypothetical protein
MPVTRTFGPIGISLPTGSGTGGNDRRVPLDAYDEAYLTSAFIVVGASSGPIWGECILRSGGQAVVLAPPAWIRGDANFGGTDFWWFIGQQGLNPQGGNELVPLLRNDSGSAATPQVGGTLLIVRD